MSVFCKIAFAATAVSALRIQTNETSTTKAVAPLTDVTNAAQDASTISTEDKLSKAATTPVASVNAATSTTATAADANSTAPADACKLPTEGESYADAVMKPVQAVVNDADPEIVEEVEQVLDEEAGEVDNFMGLLEASVMKAAEDQEALEAAQEAKMKAEAFEAAKEALLKGPDGFELVMTNKNKKQLLEFAQRVMEKAKELNVTSEEFQSIAAAFLTNKDPKQTIANNKKLMETTKFTNAGDAVVNELPVEKPVEKKFPAFTPVFRSKMASEIEITASGDYCFKDVRIPEEFRNKDAGEIIFYTPIKNDETETGKPVGYLPAKINEEKTRNTFAFQGTIEYKEKEGCWCTETLCGSCSCGCSSEEKPEYFEGKVCITSDASESNVKANKEMIEKINKAYAGKEDSHKMEYVVATNVDPKKYVEENQASNQYAILASANE